MTSRFDSILFDFDGVLADTEPIHFRCWQRIFSSYGRELEWASYDRLCRGMGERDMVNLLCGQSSPALPAERVWAEYPNKTEQFRKNALERDLIGGAVRDLLKELGSYRLAVVSSSARAEVEPVLIAGGIRDSFSALVCGEDVERLKPAPDPYLRGATLVGGRWPLVVEDSDTGAASGRAAGFEVLQIPSCEQMPELLRLRLGAGCRTG